MRSLLKASLLAATVMTPGMALAQTSGDEGATQGDGDRPVIVVSARKTEETLADTPIAITAFTEGDIDDAGLDDVRDIADLTPGLQFNGDFGRNAERPVIRGIANLRPETAQPVSLFVDGVYVRTGLVSTFLDNIERIEVLKGPQAALYGRSTYGGVINYVTRKPGDELSAKVTGTIAEHDTYELSGIVSVPFGDSGFSVQAGGRYSQFGGSYPNTDPNTQGARDVGSEETKAGFATLRFNPASSLDVWVSGFYSEDRDGQFVGQLFDSTNNNSVVAGGASCPEVRISYYCGIAQETDTVAIATSVNAGDDVTPGGFPPGTFAAGWDFRAGLDRDIARGTFGLSADLTDSIQMQLLGGYTEEDLRVQTNQSYSPVIVGNSFGSFPSAWVTDDVTDRTYWTLEGRLSGETGPVSWLLGAFHYDEEFSGIDRDILDTDYVYDGASTNVETSVFGSLRFALTDSLTIGAEGRYGWEDVTSQPVENGDVLEASFSGFTPRFTVDLDLPGGTLLYGSASKGTKAGGFNNVNPNDPDEAPFLVFNEEEVWQYELGAKTTFADGFFVLDIAAFRLDLSNQQLSQVVVLNEGTPDQVQITVVQNVGESRVNGVEVDLGIYPSDNLMMRLTYALADTKVIEGTDAQQTLILGDPSFAGSDIPRVAESSGTATLQWTPPITDDWEGLFRVDGIYTGTRFAQIHNLQETGVSLRANARIGVKNDMVEFTLWGRNIFQDRTSAGLFRYVDPGDFRFFRRAYMSFLPRERQFGATLRLRYP